LWLAVVVVEVATLQTTLQVAEAVLADFARP
jgi:hypothetical protein